MPHDSFLFRQFTVRQDRCAMKVGTDGTLLGAWARLPQSVRGEDDALPPRILDVGTGTGLVALMMAQRHPSALVTGIDIDAEAVGQAAENAAQSPFGLRVAMMVRDASAAASDDLGQFDAIVCNPPFFADALPSPDARRTMARHTATLSFRQLMACARRLLADGGELSVIVPAQGRRQMESEAALAGLFPTRLCHVRTAPASPRSAA